jgi:hypothetical protein
MDKINRVWVCKSGGSNKTDRLGNKHRFIFKWRGLKNWQCNALQFAPTLKPKPFERTAGNWWIGSSDIWYSEGNEFDIVKGMRNQNAFKRTGCHSGAEMSNCGTMTSESDGIAWKKRGKKTFARLNDCFSIWDDLLLDWLDSDFVHPHRSNCFTWGKPSNWDHTNPREWFCTLSTRTNDRGTSDTPWFAKATANGHQVPLESDP